MDGLLEIPMFPLGNPFMPTEDLPLRIFEGRYIQMFGDLTRSDPDVAPVFGSVMIERGKEVGGGDKRAQFGVLAEIRGIKWSQSGDRAMVVATVTDLLEVVEWLPEVPYPRAVVEVTRCEASRTDGPFAIAYAQACTTVRQLRALAFELGAPIDPTVLVGDASDDATESGWRLCAQAPLDELDRYQLIRLRDNTDRMQALDALCQQRLDTYKFGLS